MQETFKLLLLTCFLFLLLISPAMSQEKKDVIYLSDGSTLKGTVLEYLPGSHAKIEIAGSNVLTIPEDEISKIVLNETNAFNEKNENKSGLEFIQSLNLYTGSKQSAGFNSMLSYRFPCRFSAGIGMGFESFNQQVLPVYSEVSYYLMKGKFSPFLFARAGYAISVATEDPYAWNGVTYKGGILAGAGAGLQYQISDRNAVFLSVGFRYQKLRTETGNYWYEATPSNTIERIDHIKRLAFSLGFMFN